MAVGRSPVTIDVAARLGPLALATPLVAAAGTVGSVWEFARVADTSAYGAMTAKSVSKEPWKGKEAPRLAPAGLGMLNGIGIQNPGIEAWVAGVAPRLSRIGTPVWGSAVGHTPDDFAVVAGRMAAAGVVAIEINLSCPNLDDGRMIAFDPGRSGEVVETVRAATDLPVGAKLSPDVEDIVPVAAACVEGGADWLTLTNTARGAAVDVSTRRPRISGVVGGYSGLPLKPISLACVIQVAQALPDTPVLGCGGVNSGVDVVEYLMAGASAVAIGTAHFAEPRVASRVLAEVRAWAENHGVARLADLTGAME